MTNEAILKKAISKARQNGYKQEPFVLNSVYQIEHVIFSHDFAKAFWPNKGKSSSWDVNTGEYEWQYRLQQMVLLENPIKYLEQFID